MKLSVALCTFRGTKFLEQQLLSVVNQTRPADEIILRDDCSGDGTAKLAELFFQSHGVQNFRVIRGPERLGFIQNFRACIAETTGDFVALCDQDDVWYPDKLASMENFLHRHPDAEAVAGNFTLIDGSGMPLPDSRKESVVQRRQLHRLGITNALYSKIPSFEKAPDALLCRNFAPGCTVLFSSRVRNIYLRYTQADAPHDWEILLIAQLLDGLYYWNRPTIHYRIHGENTIAVESPASLHAPSVTGREQVMEYYEAIYRAADRLLPILSDGKRLPQQYFDYAQTRRRAILQHSLRDFLRLFRYGGIYHKMFPFRQRMGDLLVVLRK